MNTYRNSSFSRMKVLALAVLLAGCSYATAKPTVNVGGRVFLDDVFFNGSDYDKNGGTQGNQSLYGSKFPSGANIREANLWFFGKVANDFDYWVQLDFLYRTPVTTHYSGDGNGGSTLGHISPTNHYTYSTRTRVNIEESWLRYTYGDVEVKVGQMYVPFGMSWTTDKSHQLFMEKPNLTKLQERRHFGINFFTFGEMWTMNAAFVAKEMHKGAIASGNMTYSTNSEEQLRNDAYAGLVRLTAAPCNEKNKVLHFGFNAKYKELHGKRYDGEDLGRYPVKWVAGPELVSRQSSPYIVSTHAVPNLQPNNYIHPVRHFHVMGVELAGKWKEFHAQAEIMHLKADYDDADNKAFKGVYAQGGWFWTGESRPYNYKKGVFENPVPDSKCGAWELVLRYSHLNLDHEEATVTAAAAPTAIQDTGKVSTFGLGVNWVINPNVAIKANYMMSKFNFRTAKDRDIKGFGVRAQLDF